MNQKSRVKLIIFICLFFTSFSNWQYAFASIVNEKARGVYKYNNNYIMPRIKEQKDFIIATFGGQQTLMINNQAPVTLSEISDFEQKMNRINIAMGEYETDEEVALRKKTMTKSSDKYKNVRFSTEMPLTLKYNKRQSLFKMIIKVCPAMRLWYLTEKAELNWKDREFLGFESKETTKDFVVFGGIYKTVFYNPEYFDADSKIEIECFNDPKGGIYRYGNNNFQTALIILLKSAVMKARMLKEREPFLKLHIRGVRCTYGYFITHFKIIDSERNQTLATFDPFPVARFQRWGEWNILTGAKPGRVEVKDISMLEFLSIWNKKNDKLTEKEKELICDEFK